MEAGLYIKIRLERENTAVAVTDASYAKKLDNLNIKTKR
jgi:hypothetical protein